MLETQHVCRPHMMEMQTYLQKNMCAFACFSIEMSKMEKKKTRFRKAS